MKPDLWPWLQRTAGLVLGYFLWIKLVQVISLSLLTYYAASGSANSFSAGHLQEINDLYSNYELSIAAGTTILFVFFLRALYPLTTLSSLRALMTWGRIRHSFIPGLYRGMAIATAFVGALLVSGYYVFGGFFVQLDEPLVATFMLALKALALLLFVYMEEYLFRRKLFQALHERLSREAAAIVCMAAYLLVKIFQFDLGLMQTLTVALISIVLSSQSAFQRDFGFGAGQWGGVLVVFHVFFGLPVFGIPQPGVFSLRYTGPVLDLDWLSQITRLLTGGTGGPLSSASFQALLLSYFVISMWYRYIRIKKFHSPIAPLAGGGI